MVNVGHRRLKPKTPEPATPADPDRQAAEWVFSLGVPYTYVFVREPGKESAEVKSLDALPSGAVSHNGQLIGTCNADHTLSIANRTTGALVHTLPSFYIQRQPQFSFDGKMLAAIDTDNLSVESQQIRGESVNNVLSIWDVTVQLHKNMKQSYEKLRSASGGELTDEMKANLRSHWIDPGAFKDDVPDA